MCNISCRTCCVSACDVLSDLRGLSLVRSCQCGYFGGLTDSLGRWSYVRFVSCCVLCVLFVCGAMQTTFFPSAAHSKHTYGHHHSRKEHLQHGIKSAKTQHGCGPRDERRNIATICFFLSTSATLLVIVRETQFMSSSTKASNKRGSTSQATDRS